jgi:tight adherence protein G
MLLFTNKFIRQQKGGLAIIFAVMLPFIFSVCALVFDGARMMSKRARLADALNEAALAIATSSLGKGTPEEKLRNQQILESFLHAYLPQDDIGGSTVTMREGVDGSTGVAVPIYDISAQLEVKSVLPLGSLAPSFTPTVEMSNGGSVRKGISTMSMPADYVFVVDFSGSMSWNTDDNSQKRITLLKKVVLDITTESLKNEPKTTFGIVPFETGVPAKRAVPQLAEEFGCELNVVLNADYDIDYEYWGRMLLAMPTANKDALTRRIYLHHYRYKVHNEYIMKKLGYSSMEAYANATGVCESMKTLKDNNLTQYNNLNSLSNYPVPYVCDFLPKDDALSLRFIPDPRGIEANLVLIENEYKQFSNVMMPTLLGGNRGEVFKITTVDVKKTLEGMFDKGNLKTWSIPDATFIQRYMNGSSGPYTMSRRGGFDYTCTSAFQKDSTGQQLNYLIELTSDINTLDEFQRMQPVGGTISTTGVLRAAQVLAKGTNPRKVMIIISDGEDNNTDLKDAFHKPKAPLKPICDVIREDLPKHSTDTEEVDIYFISVVGSATDVNRARYWENYCTGEGNSFVATNYKDLMDKLTSIVSAYEETGYFNNR